MRWFGKDWGAPACEAGQHFNTPVGTPCDVCEQPIAKGDDGVISPVVNAFTRPVPGTGLQGIGVPSIVFHLDCFMHHIGARGYPCTHKKK